jgi:hypothetical protein
LDGHRTAGLDALADDQIAGLEHGFRDALLLERIVTMNSSE